MAVSLLLGRAAGGLLASCPQLSVPRPKGERTDDQHYDDKDEFRRRTRTVDTASLLAMSQPRSLNASPQPSDLLHPTEAFGGSLKTLTAVGNSTNKSIRRRNKTKLAKKSRLVQKSGCVNVCSWNVPKRDRQFLRDIFTTLIDVQWRVILLVFIVTFWFSWLVFAIVYYVFAALHGDFSATHTLSVTTQPLAEKGTFARAWAAAAGAGNNNSADGTTALDHHHKPCFQNVDSVLGAFLFSVETQHTIGYGFRPNFIHICTLFHIIMGSFITTECTLAVGVMCVQCICGLLLQSFMVGLVFAKLARPKKRAETLIFSEKAVISLRDGRLCLLLRVGDMRNTHLVEAHIRVQLIKQRTTAEGEVEPLYQYELELGENGNDDRLFLVWPLTVCHPIGPDSPLYDVNAQSLPTEQFEVIVILEGIVESTGMTVQARTSYLPREIVWGHRFEKLVTYQSDNGAYRIDYSLIHNTYAVDSPLYSARELQRKSQAGQQLHYFYKAEAEALMEENKFLECSPMPSPFGQHGSFRSRLPSGLEHRLANHRGSDVSQRSVGSHHTTISEHSMESRELPPVSQPAAANNGSQPSMPTSSIPPSSTTITSTSMTTTANNSVRQRPSRLVSPPRIVVESPSSPIQSHASANHVDNHDSPVGSAADTQPLVGVRSALASHRNSSFITDKPFLDEVVEESVSELSTPITETVVDFSIDDS